MNVYIFVLLLMFIAFFLATIITSLISRDIVWGFVIGLGAFLITVLVGVPCLPRLPIKYGEVYKTEYKAEDIALSDTKNGDVKYLASWDEGDGQALTQKVDRAYFCDGESYIVKIDYKWGFLTLTEYELYVQK